MTIGSDTGREEPQTSPRTEQIEEAARTSDVGEERGDQRGDEHRGVGTLIADLSRDTATLFRQELELARAEMREKVDEAKQGVAMSATSGGVLLAGLIILLMSATYALGLVWPLWAAALLVGALTVLIGGGLAGAGFARLKSTHFEPKRTLRSLQRGRDLARGAFPHQEEARERATGRPVAGESYA